MHLLVSEQYIDSIMRGVTIKVLIVICKGNALLCKAGTGFLYIMEVNIRLESVNRSLLYVN